MVSILISYFKNRYYQKFQSHTDLNLNHGPILNGFAMQDELLTFLFLSFLIYKMEMIIHNHTLVSCMPRTVHFC